MRSRILVFTGAAALGLAFLAGGVPSRAESASRGPRPPSILVVLTDDMAVGDADSMETVQDRLVREGASFSSFFVTTPVCCPSRASILRGQYSHNHGVLSNAMPTGGYRRFAELGREDSTLATWLKDAGYRTGFFGKYMNGYPLPGARRSVPPGWDDWFSPVAGRANTGFGYTVNDGGGLVRFGRSRDDYFTDVLCRETEDFLRGASADGVPFLAVVSPAAPHKPATPAPQDRGKFDGVEAPRPPSFDEEDVDDKPMYVQRRRRLRRPQVRRLDHIHRRRLESLQSVDRMVFRLLDELEAAGRLEDTFVFFLSDNGFHLGHHRLRPGKFTPYDEDVRVPFFVRGPGVPAGRSLPHLAANVDLAPTFAAIAGIEAPSFVDGRSLLPLLGGEPPTAAEWRQCILLEQALQTPRGSRWLRDRYEDETTFSANLPDSLEGRLQIFFQWQRPSIRFSPPSFYGLVTNSLKMLIYGSREVELYYPGDDFELDNLYEAPFPRHGPDDEPARLQRLMISSGSELRAYEDIPFFDLR